MIKKDLKYLFILALMAFGALFSWNLYFKTHHQTDRVSIHLFPKELDKWSSEEMQITDDEYAILETKNAFVRRYFTPDENEVYLFIVYSESNRKVSHPPEVCYIGSGASVTSSAHAELSANYPIKGKILENSLQTNRLILEQGGTKQIVYYWFKVGDTFTSNYWKQQLLIAVKTLLGQPASSALVRVSATVHSGNVKKAEQDIQMFSRPVIPMLFKYLP